MSTGDSLRGYGNKYLVSMLTGHIYKRVGKNYVQMSQSLKKNGYLRVSIHGTDKYVHRVIMSAFLGRELTRNEEVNHLNHVVTDNSIINLQLTDHRGNMQYRQSLKNSSSQFVGVYWIKAMNKWRAQIQLNGKKIHIGYFKCEHEAGRAWNREASKLNREQGCNFRLNDIRT